MAVTKLYFNFKDYMFDDETNEEDWLLRAELDDAENDLNNAVSTHSISTYYFTIPYSKKNVPFL